MVQPCGVARAEHPRHKPRYAHDGRHIAGEAQRHVGKAEAGGFEKQHGDFGNSPCSREDEDLEQTRPLPHKDARHGEGHVERARRQRAQHEGEERPLGPGFPAHEADDGLPVHPHVEEAEEHEDRRKESQHLGNAFACKHQPLFGLGTVDKPASKGQRHGEDEETVLPEHGAARFLFLFLRHHIPPKTMPMNTASAKE